MTIRKTRSEDQHQTYFNTRDHEDFGGKLLLILVFIDFRDSLSSGL